MEEVKELEVERVYECDGLVIKATFDYEEGLTGLAITAKEGTLAIIPKGKNEIGVYNLDA